MSDLPESSSNIDHDLIDAVESGMREYVNAKLELFVQLTELEDVVASQIARGTSREPGFSNCKLFKTILYFKLIN